MALVPCLVATAPVIVHGAAAQSLPAISMVPAHFQKRVWTQDNGTPRNIVHIAQTPDGYLWIASQEGLYRFDGASFEEIRPPAGSQMEGASPQSLLVTRKGELWVSYSRSAGVAVYRHGRLIDTRFPNPPSVITNLVEGADGAIWAEWGGLSRRLWRYRGGTWQPLDGALHVPEGYMLGMVGTPDGSLWVAIQRPDQRSSGIARLAPGAAQFTWLGGTYRMPRLGVAPDGALWLADGNDLRLFRTADQREPRAEIRYRIPAELSLTGLAFDRFGGIWGGTRNGEVFRANTAAHAPGDRPGQIELFDNLAWRAKVGARLFVDAEGSIWLGRGRQLERFRRANVTADPLVRGDMTRGLKLTATSDGLVYALADQVLFLIRPDSETRALRRIPDPMAMCAGHASGVWILDRKQTMRVRADGALDSLGSVPTLAARCAEDGQSRLWLRGLDGSTWWRDGSGWHPLRGYEAPGGSGVTVGAVANADGEVALANEAPGMTLVSGAKVIRYDFRSLGMDEITMINPGEHGFFIAGRRGLIRLRDGAARKLDARIYPWLARISGIVQTPRGETWLRDSDGLKRILTAELDRAFEQPGTPIAVREFDSRDGAPLDAQPYGFPTRSIVSGGDGRIWTITAQGLASIDPAHLFDPPAPPKVTIRSLETGSRLILDPVSLTLPPGTTTVRFVFSVMGLADPDRVRTQYRLIGLETGWTDPGARRATTYTNLAPGKYRFEVIAADAAGNWNLKGAALEFEIRPTFLQSWPFKLLCVVAALALLWGAYRLRMRAVAAQIRARLAERHDERERIARDLHDTLLQSVQALILRFHLASDALPQDAPGKKGLEDTLGQAQRVLGEARERVRGLRLHADPETLEPAISGAAREMGFTPGENLFVSTSGMGQRLDPEATAEILHIAREALFNVMRHARATRTEVHIDYRPAMLQLTVRDDGIGIDPSILRAGRREGHFGLVGMRERAARLKAEMILDRSSSGGTTIILMVPAATAYGDVRRRWYERFLRRRSR